MYVAGWGTLEFLTEDKSANGDNDPNDEFQFLNGVKVFEWRMREIGSVLALLSPWLSPDYFKRAWCLFEFWEAERLAEVEIHLVLPEQEDASMHAALDSGGRA